ncbi:MAG: hypothetical protein ACO3IJ_06325 [Steroidobacteraceae bacterium]
MTAEVEAHVLAIAQVLQHAGQALHVIRRDLRHARGEADGRDDVAQLDGLDFLALDLLDLQPVAALLAQERRVQGPFLQGLAVGHVPLGRMTNDLGLHRRGLRQLGQRGPQPGQEGGFDDHGRTSPRLTGPPRRQNTSGSMVSR